MKVKGEIPLWKRSGLKAAINESTKYQHRTIQFCSAEAWTWTMRPTHGSQLWITRLTIPEDPGLGHPHKEQASSKPKFCYSLHRKFLNLTQAEQRVNAQHSNLRFFFLILPPDYLCSFISQFGSLRVIKRKDDRGIDLHVRFSLVCTLAGQIWTVRRECQKPSAKSLERSSIFNIIQEPYKSVTPLG